MSNRIHQARSLSDPVSDADMPNPRDPPISRTLPARTCRPSSRRPKPCRPKCPETTAMPARTARTTNCLDRPDRRSRRRNRGGRRRRRRSRPIWRTCRRRRRRQPGVHARQVRQACQATWLKQDANRRLIRKLVCAVPCWGCVIECHVCPLLKDDPLTAEHMALRRRQAARRRSIRCTTCSTGTSGTRTPKKAVRAHQGGAWRRGRSRPRRSSKALDRQRKS